MDGSETTREIVERLDSEIDRIDGLITLRAAGGRVAAIVESRDQFAHVRAGLERLGLPRTLLDIYNVRDFLIPYPNDDERLVRWVNRLEEQE